MSVAVELGVSLDIRKRMVGGSSDEDGMRQKDKGGRHGIIKFGKLG